MNHLDTFLEQCLCELRYRNHSLETTAPRLDISFVIH